MTRLAAVLTVLTLTVLAFPVTASAAVRYAVASGGAIVGPCTAPATACALPTALSTSVNGDTVRMAPGTYPVGDGYPAIFKALTIEGDPALPRPVILGASGSPGNWALWLAGGLGATQVLRHVEVRQAGVSTAYGLIIGSGGLATGEDLVVAGTGQAAVLLGNVVLRDSVIRSVGSGTAIASGASGDTNAEIRNVTAFGGGYGLGAVGSGSSTSGSVTTIRNSILIGATADIYALGAAAGKPGLVFVDHSSFDTVDQQPFGLIDQSGGANQTAAPLLADLPGGIVRPLAGSPTIDAGVTDSFTGTKDPDGNPRTLGAAPDIGAFEFVPPAPPAAPQAPAAPAAAGDTAIPQLLLAGIPKRTTAAVLRRGLRLRITTDEPAALALTLTARRGVRGFLAATPKPKARTVTLGRASAPSAAGTRTVTLRAGAKALGRAQRLRVSVTVTATDTAGNVARIVRSVSVAPPAKRR